MRLSPAGRAFLTIQEGVRLTAYRDSAGVWTIGVGHTSAAGLPEPKAGMTITAEEADAILTADLVQFEQAVSDLVKVSLAQHAFDALVSLAFNIGAGAFSRSTLLARLNAGNRAGAAKSFFSWVYAGGRKTAGLSSRRWRENRLFTDGIYEGVPDTVSRTGDGVPADAPAIDADRVTIARLNLRASPGDGAVRLVLPENHPVETAEIWLKVTALVDGALTTGWVAGQYTREIGC